MELKLQNILKNKFININLEGEGSFVSKLIKQPWVLYIISFMVSIVGFSENIFPFGIAMIAAACSLNIPIGVMLVLTLIGTYIGQGEIAAIVHIITVVIFVISMMIIRPKKIVGTEENEQLKLGKYVFFSCLLVQAVKLISTQILVYNVLESVMFCIITFIFYKIFVNSIGVIKEYGKKKAFSIEEIIGASLVIAIALSAFGGLTVWGLSIRNILCIFLVMFLGWKNGILVGGTIGITIGVVLGIIGINEPIMIAAFALSGLLAGILNRFGKIGVIIGFIVGNAVLTYISNGNITALIHLREIFIASIGLLLLPKKLELKMEDIMGMTNYLPTEREKLLEASRDTAYKLSTVSDTIQEIAKTYDTDDKLDIETREKLEKENEQLFIEEAINNLSGATKNSIYEEIADVSNNILKDLYRELCRKGELRIDDLLIVFAKNNNYIVGVEDNKAVQNDIEVILKVLNYTYQISKLNFIWKQKMIQSRKNVSNELNGVSKVISALATEITKKPEENFEVQEKEIRVLFKQKKIKVSEIKIKKGANGKYSIYLYREIGENNQYTLNIEKILSTVFEQNIKHHKTEILEDDSSMQVFLTEDKFTLHMGLAKLNKNNNKVSGDSYIKTTLNDGKHLIAISDGMGTGKDAKKSSSVAIKMLDRLLKEGFDKDASIELINSTMVLSSNEDMYATLDVAILDLYTGNIECIKNGACPTYVKSEGKVQQIQAISLPAGILNNIDLVVYEKDLQNEDIIVMCSDGIVESKADAENKELWVKTLLEDLITDNVQKIADIILAEARDNSFGIPKDDMTVIVLKVTG